MAEGFAKWGSLNRTKRRGLLMSRQEAGRVAYQ